MVHYFFTRRGVERKSIIIIMESLRHHLEHVLNQLLPNYAAVLPLTTLDTLKTLLIQAIDLCPITDCTVSWLSSLPLAGNFDEPMDIDDE